MLSAEFLRSKFQAGLPYAAYVSTAKPGERPRWDAMNQRSTLTPAQTALLKGFHREMNVLVVSGTWCGDCVQQCPLIARIAESNPDKIHLRFVDRDQHHDLADRIMINAGHRVPTAIFMAEDFEFVSLLGDRTLSRYRAAAARQLGPACPVPGAPVPDDELAACLQEWLNEFERVQLLLRLSTRLREMHGD